MGKMILLNNRAMVLPTGKLSLVFWIIKIGKRIGKGLSLITFVF